MSTAPREAKTSKLLFPVSCHNSTLEGSKACGCNLYTQALENIPKGRMTKATNQHREKRLQWLLQTVTLKKTSFNSPSALGSYKRLCWTGFELLTCTFHLWQWNVPTTWVSHCPFLCSFSKPYVSPAEKAEQIFLLNLPNFAPQELSLGMT